MATHRGLADARSRRANKRHERHQGLGDCRGSLLLLFVVQRRPSEDVRRRSRKHPSSGDSQSDVDSVAFVHSVEVRATPRNRAGFSAERRGGVFRGLWLWWTAHSLNFFERLKGGCR